MHIPPLRVSGLHRFFLIFSCKQSCSLNRLNFPVVMVGLRASWHSPLFQNVQGAWGISWHRNSEAQPKNKWSFSPSLPTRHRNDSKLKIKTPGFPANLETACAKSKRGMMAHRTGPKMSCQRECSRAHTARDRLPHSLPGQLLSSHTENGSLLNISVFSNIETVDLQ